MQQAGGKFCYLWLMKQYGDSLFLAYQLQGSPILGRLLGLISMPSSVTIVRKNLIGRLIMNQRGILGKL